VQDTIRALQSLMESPATTGEIYKRRLEELDHHRRPRAAGARAHGLALEIVYVPYDKVYGGGIDDMLHRLPAIEKIAAAIGWQPERDPRRDLTDVIAFARGAATSPA